MVSNQVQNRESIVFLDGKKKKKTKTKKPYLIGNSGFLSDHSRQRERLLFSRRHQGNWLLKPETEKELFYEP